MEVPPALAPAVDAVAAVHKWVSAHATYLYLSAITFALVYVLFKLFLPDVGLAFRQLPGPARTSVLLGNQRELLRDGPAACHERWLDTYGPTIRLWRPFGKSELLTVDPGALSYVFRTSDEAFVKPAGIRLAIAANVGNGVLTVEGHTHRRHRRVLNPAFGWAQIQDMVPAMWAKGYELQRKMTRDLEDPYAAPAEHYADNVPGARKFDMFAYLSTAALDIIGMVALGEDLGSLSDRPNELREGYNNVLRVGFLTDAWTVIRFALPFTRKIPLERNRIVRDGREAVIRFGKRVIAEKRQLLNDIYGGRIDKTMDTGKDVLSLVMRANTASDLRDDQRLTDDEVIAQIATLMFTGHETTGTATGFCLQKLAHHPQFQDRLRAEILSIDEDEPSFETLNALPFLHAVVRESLRLEGPVPVMTRVATRDVAIPLSVPIVGRDGKMVDTVNMKKGNWIALPFQAANRCKVVWGEDAREFNPDRFARPGLPAKKLPGVWGELTTFASGPHNCIGHRMAVAEMKVLLFILIRYFIFEPLPSKPKIKPAWMIIQRAVVDGEEERGPQMPFLVRPVPAQ